MTHICVGKLTIIGSDNGLSPERRQAIIWTNDGILFIGPLGTNFGEILIEIQTFSLKKMRLKMSSAKCCSFHLGLNVLTDVDVSFVSVHVRTVRGARLSPTLTCCCDQDLTQPGDVMHDKCKLLCYSTCCDELLFTHYVFAILVNPLSISMRRNN